MRDDRDPRTFARDAPESEGQAGKADTAPLLVPAQAAAQRETAHIPALATLDMLANSPTATAVAPISLDEPSVEDDGPKAGLADDTLPAATPVPSHLTGTLRAAIDSAWVKALALNERRRRGLGRWAERQAHNKPTKGHRSRRAEITRSVGLVVVIFAVVTPTAWGVVSTYLQYQQMRTLATDGISHLRNVQSLLQAEAKQPSIPSAITLENTQHELAAAESDFALLRHQLGRGPFAVAAHAPGVSGPASSAEALAAAADEACLAGIDLVQGAATLLPVLNAGFFAGDASSSASEASSSPGSSAPALTTDTLNSFAARFDDAVRHLTTGMAFARRADLATLPQQLVKPQQVGQLRQAIAAWPHLQEQLAEVGSWLKVAPVVLGTQAPVTYLVELMDRSELRPTGGFIGNYGLMTLQNGKVQPFTLNDVYLLDYPYVFQHNWPAAPAAYSWWPYPGFALRDSNVSPNFPTTAQLGMHQLAQEGGPRAQGVIALTAPAIARVIAITGPINVPEYHETVTAQNLEALIHHYQETSAYTAGSDLPPVDQISSTHKRFTALLGRAFMARLHGLPTSELLAIGKTLLASLHTKDIQVYLGDNSAEALLAQHGLDGTIAHGPGDAITLVDANVGSNKANLFTTAAYKDSVTLDARGTASHDLTITYTFATATNPSMVYLLYGRDYYLTYLRVYAPPSAQLVHQDGFNGGAVQLNTSDEPGRRMWGGYVRVANGVPYSLHFRWTVPNAATRDAGGHWHYALVVQRQAGATQRLTLRVTTPASTKPIISYQGPLDTDESYSMTYQLPAR